MKRFLFFSLLAFMCNLIFAQDIIYKRTGDQIKSKITEVSAETIKYKEFDFQDGPVRVINVKDVFMIIYQNGKREVFTPADYQNQKPVAKTETPGQAEVSKPAAQTEPPVNKYKGNYFMIGSGYGTSYGGAGFRAQLRLGGKVGFGLHAGVGVSPEAPVLASAGLKFFPYKGMYFDAQFGLTGVNPYYDESSSAYDEKSHLYYGPSFLLGVDQVWGRKVGFGFNAGLGVTLNANADEDVDIIKLAIDLGFIVRF
jgi:hypothetical protein